jgi:ankyrin repeat protein
MDLMPMSYAVQDAAPDLIRDLLDRGGDVHKGELLQHAVERPTDAIEVLGILLDRGAPLNDIMYQHHRQSASMCILPRGTPLHTAASLGKADTVRYLLRRGADPTILNNKRRTAQACAEEEGHADVAGILKLAVEELQEFGGKEPPENGAGVAETCHGGDSEA